jgi:putative copper resistance protein D
MLHALYTISVYVHVVAACAWVGSMLFFSTVLVPVLRRPEQAVAAGPLVRLVGLRFRTFGWVCIGTLLATGVLNLGMRGVGLDTLTSGPFWADGFGRALAYKLASVVVVVGLTGVHDALSLRPQARRLASWLGRMTLVASLLVILFAVWLVRGTP